MSNLNQTPAPLKQTPEGDLYRAQEALSKAKERADKALEEAQKSSVVNKLLAERDRYEALATEARHAALAKGRVPSPKEPKQTGHLRKRIKPTTLAAARAVQKVTTEARTALAAAQLAVESTEYRSSKLAREESERLGLQGPGSEAQDPPVTDEAQ